MMEVVFLAAKVPMIKSFTRDTVTAYPLVKNVTSYHENVNTLHEYADKLREHAEKGHCLYKGLLKRKLENESRKGETNTLAETRLLVLDIDGLPLDIPGLKGVFTREKLKIVAEKVISQITSLREVSYVACASSSCGTVDSARLHLHFFLDDSVPPKALKAWLQKLNLDHFNDKLKLAPHGAALKYPVDHCLADNSRIIYIAPPAFDGVDNPFADNGERIVIVKKQMETAPLSGDIRNIDPERVSQALDAKIDQLHEAANLKRRKITTSAMKFNNGNYEVVNNPNQMFMRYAYHNDKFCYYNVGAKGDSNAYYVYLDNPEIVWNFKGEPPFLFEKADKDAYLEHLDRFKSHVPKTESAAKQPIVYLEDGSNFLTMLFSKKEQAIVAEELTGDKSKAEMWFNNYGRSLPDVIPPAKRRFDPTTTDIFTMDESNGYTIINTFRPTPYMRNPLPEWIPDVGYRNAWLLQFICPTIYKIISHMVAYDDVTVCHFLNWFAFIFQNRRKAETCWVLQGTQGTGKGAFYRNVCRPLWGEQYAFEKQLQNFEDDKNGWEERAMLVLIDEVNMKTLRNSGKTEALLKNLITDDERTIRAMRRDQVQTKSYTNIIMSTNDFDALNIPDNDRRYNVAPRQEVMLRTVYPEFVYQREEVDALLADEIEDMAAYLQHFKVDVPQAYIALENTAKQDAREAGKTSSQAFFSAIRKADLDYFSAVLSAQEVDVTMAVIASKCRTAVTRWLVDCKNERVSFVESEELRLMYQLIEGTREITSTKFGRLCTKMGITVNAYRQRDKRGMRLTWLMDKNLLDMAMESVSDTDKQKFDTARAVVSLNNVAEK